MSLQEKKVLDFLLHHLQKSKLGIEGHSLAAGYGYDKKEGIAFRDQAITALRENGYGIDEIPVYQIGATIGIHTGPYPIGFGIIERAIHPSAEDPAQTGK